MAKSISEMSDDELKAELLRLEAIRVPASPARKPKAVKEPKPAKEPKTTSPKAKRAAWKNALDL